MSRKKPTPAPEQDDNGFRLEETKPVRFVADPPPTIVLDPAIDLRTVPDDAPVEIRCPGCHSRYVPAIRGSVPKKSGAVRRRCHHCGRKFTK